MPIEIKELVIKAEFGNPRQEDAESGAAEPVVDQQADVIQECVRQVLEILDRRGER